MTEKLTYETTLSTTEAAAISGLTARRIQQLQQDGAVRMVKRGVMKLGWFIEDLQATKRKQNIDPQNEDVEARRKAAEAKLKEAKAEIARAEADELKGKMHRSEDIRKLTEEFIYAVRGGMMALPGRLAVDMVGIETAAEASDIIKKEVYKLLNEMSEYKYDPERYQQLVRERREWEAEHMEQQGEADE